MADHIIYPWRAPNGDKQVAADGYIVQECSCGVVVATHQAMVDHLVESQRRG